MQTQSEAGSEVGRTQARRVLPVLLLDRDALERFLERAAALMPEGALTTVLAVRDGERTRSFSTLRDLAADPDLSTQLRAVEIAVARREGEDVTHELALRDEDGQTILLATGDELWAFGALGILCDHLDIYAKRLAAKPLPAVAPANFFSAGFALALVFVVARERGIPAAGAVALCCAAAWFVLDMALSELRLALMRPRPLSLTIEIRSVRRENPRPATLRLWLAARALSVLVWLLVAYVVLRNVVPHVPKRW